jgi:hypothetical protein
MENRRVDGDRLWQSLMFFNDTATTEKGGGCRLALTDVDRAAPFMPAQ